MSDEIQHPGAYVRARVIPVGMTVKKAAELIEVSRPTLSNLLNGNADLSPDMAARLNTAFGVPARELLDLQSAWDASRAKRRTSKAKAYVPPFLQIKASRIEAWASSGLAPRQRLSVLLRTLVNSTAEHLSKVDFPGNDDSEQPGWDGEVIADQATAWIPAGHSGWEFGVNQDVKRKADGDYAKSVAAVDEKSRKSMTFVFVTPRDWPGKATWIKEQKAKKNWKDVRAHDASDLEQWLEQSLPGQTWFASETGQDANGAISLDEAWKAWAADCDPPLTPALFGDSVRLAEGALRRGLTEKPHRPLIVTADSKDEALAFLSAAFAPDGEQFGTYRDRIIVFREPGALSKLASQVSNFIPVIASRDVEKEFAPFRSSMPSFIVYPRNALGDEPDIELETLNWQSFETALQAMGLDRDRIDQLSRESGRSPTVLRRRLSKLPAISRPDWASNVELAKGVTPFLFAGTWKADNKTDQAMLELLAGDIPYAELEHNLATLLPLDGSPVWSVGSLRGVVSKIDVLFAICDAITSDELERFFAVAEVVLSEDDPALDLPEKDRWAAGIYGKTREISGALRRGLGETLVLLSVYGPGLFRPRLNFDPALRAAHIVRSLLTPLTAEKLESQIDNVGVYAEAAPEAFLALIESDLRSPQSAALAMMRPNTDAMFGSTPRTGLLWALEGLGWSDPLFMRTVLVLGQLAERPLDDNLVNKPSNSLAAMFRAWMPQTSAPIEARKAAFRKLAEQHPKVAWPICIDQFAAHSRFGGYSHKPHWRPDGHGLGEPVSHAEANDFALFAFDMAINWPSLTCPMVCDLVDNLSGVDEDLQIKVWDVVEAWAKTASEGEKGTVRERIRVTTMTRRAIKQKARRKAARAAARAKAIYENLEPLDPVQRNAWLFKTSWVDESAEEIEDEAFDYRAREERIARLREQAVREVFDTGGGPALIELAETGEAGYSVGWSFATVMADEAALVEALHFLISAGELEGARRAVVRGILNQAADRGLLEKVSHLVSPHKVVPLLASAPFDRKTWAVLASFGAAVEGAYWRDVSPNWNRDKEDLVSGVNQLVRAGRPRAAFQFSHFSMKELPPLILFDLLAAIARGSDEPANAYLLDRHDLREAFRHLNQSDEVKPDAMSGLEFAFIDIFDDDEARPENLEREIAGNPDLFAQAVGLSFKRSDDGEDPPELRTEDADVRSSRARSAYKLLDVIAVVPGRGADGTIESADLIRWVEQARASCAAIAREEIGDQMIGKLLSHAPSDVEGIWPCLAVRDALEKVMTEHIERGLSVALFNSRGATWRGDGGDQERGIAAKYARWADAMEYTHPRVAAMHRGMERQYLRDADREDTDAKANRRMIR